MKHDTIFSGKFARHTVAGREVLNLRSVPKCLACGERCLTIVEDPSSKGHCYGCRMQALGVPMDDTTLERQYAGTVKMFDYSLYFSTFALLLTVAVIFGLIFTDQPKGFHGTTSAVEGGPAAVLGGVAAGPQSEVKR